MPIVGLSSASCGLTARTARLTVSRMRRMFRLHPYLTTAFVLSSLAALAFLIDFILGVMAWERGGPARDIKPWMTVGLVARNWDLDPREVDARAGLPLPVDGRPFTLQEIADDRGVPVGQIIALLADTLREMKRAEHRGGGQAGPPAGASP
jgi:hypothetical protein